MSSPLLKNGLLAIAAVAGGYFVLTQRPLIYEFIGVHPQDIAQAKAEREAKVISEENVQPETKQLSGSAASIRKADDGQYWTEARVNSTTIRFLVDTGASVVALTPSDAQRAGFRPRDLIYDVPVNTAAGRVMSAHIDLKIVSVGNVTVRDVSGVVIPKGLSHSLLGMSYLGQLQKVEATQRALILRQ